MRHLRKKVEAGTIGELDMILCFTLSMPGCPSWNGRWSGEGRLYAKTWTVTGKTATKLARGLLANKSYYYRWEDGWAANVSVREVTSQEAAKIRKKSAGFCGYEWMIESIKTKGKIEVTPSPIPVTPFP